MQIDLKSWRFGEGDMVNSYISQVFLYSIFTCKLQQKELEHLVKKTYIDMVNRCGFEPYISHISFIMYSIYFPKRSTSKAIDPLCFWSPNPSSPRDVHLEIPATQQRWRTNRLHHVVLLGRCPNWTPVFCCKKPMDWNSGFFDFSTMLPAKPAILPTSSAWCEYRLYKMRKPKVP